MPPLSPYVARLRHERARHLKAQLAAASLVNPDLPGDIHSLIAVVISTGLQQKDLARLLGTSQPTVSRWIAARQVPDAPYQRRLLVEALRRILSDRVDMLIRGPQRPRHPPRPVSRTARDPK